MTGQNTALVKKRVVSLQVSTGSYQAMLQAILTQAASRKPAYTCVANVHMSVEAMDSPSFQQQVNDAAFVTPDGMPLAKAIKWLYGHHQDRVAGMDLIIDLFAEAEKRNQGVFLLGSTEPVIKAMQKKIAQQYPKLQLSAFSPPFRALTSEENEAIVNRIAASKAAIIMVSMGCPKQEKWMAAHHKKIAGMCIGLGGAFPVYAGTVKRAPLWMQRASLEWLYRLSQEPGRLFKRYAYTNTKFVLALVIQKFFG